ncbi:MAG: mechanosensitive ion channel family protein [Polyangiaceae bacterium]|nr:mechanosensitive ion channel family protein [Polyangiaceae bacterium]
MWDALLAEILEDQSLVLLAGLVLTSVLVRSREPAERARLRPFALFTLAHFLVLPLVAGLRASGATAYSGVRLAALVLLALAGVGLAGLFLFAILLPLLRIRAPLILRDLVTVAGVAVSIVFLANQAGFPLSGLITTSAVLTAVVGFSMQDTLGNLMGGIALQLDRSLQAGDWVKIGDVVGKVTEIRWRYTAIETRNWETVLIANSVLAKSQLSILGRRQEQPIQWRRWVWFNVDYRHAPSDVISAVQEALRGGSIQAVASEPPPQCVLMDLGESYGRYAVRYWLTDLAVDDGTDSAVRNRVYFALKRASIPLSIPAHALFLTQESNERRTQKEHTEHDRRLAALGVIELFDSLVPAERAELADALEPAPFTAGEVMTRQGAEAHWLYVIVHGEAIVRVADGAIEREVARLGAGEFFGEMSLMTGAPRSATVVAATDVDCFRLDKAAFQTVLDRHPDFAGEVAGILARRRVGLEAAREGLDAEARERRLAETSRDLLGRIRCYFGLATGGDSPLSLRGSPLPGGRA